LKTYDLADHELHDGSWPDFHLTDASVNAIDQGTTSLPSSLAALLETFDVQDYTWGDAIDIGRYEAGFTVRPDPTARAIDVGGTARYALRLHPPNLPHTVTLTLSPSPAGLSHALNDDVISPGEVVTLTVTHDGSVAGRDAWHTLAITGMGGGFVRGVSVDLLVGGARVYLPAVFRNH
jgi:hypothetical protein